MLTPENCPTQATALELGRSAASRRCSPGQLVPPLTSEKARHPASADLLAASQTRKPYRWGLGAGQTEGTNSWFDRIGATAGTLGALTSYQPSVDMPPYPQRLDLKKRVSK